MGHPSMDVPPDPDDDDNGQLSLPEGVKEEDLHGLFDRAVESAERLGLHSTGMADFQQHGDHLLLAMHFTVGELAFAKKVQDPEQAKFDDQFRSFAAGATQEQRDDILSRYTKPKADYPDEAEE